MVDCSIQAIQALKMDQAIIFCRTKQQCDHMRDFLEKHSYSAVCLHGDRSTEQRSGALADFKAKKTQFLICSNVAARGVDVAVAYGLWFLHKFHKHF